MPKLIIKLANEIVDRIDVQRGDMRIGRKPGCEIHIDSLAVSGEHANIFTVGEDSFIQDLGSTNGTYVNNKKITKHHLRNDDVISIGKHSLVYLKEPAESFSDHAKTVVITTPTQDMRAKEAEAKQAARAEAAKKELPGAFVVLSGGSSNGKRIELTKSIVNFGKSGRQAGSIIRGADGYYLTSGKGENPKLNGRAITANNIKLKNGDIIDVAGTRLQFYLK